MAKLYRRLGRNQSARKALIRDLVTDLIINEKIVTTLHKAKELRKVADKMVTWGKKGDLAARRQAAKLIRFEKTEEGEFAIQKLFSDIAPRFKDRQGGYTRVLQMEARRGDSAPMAVIEFVE